MIDSIITKLGNKSCCRVDCSTLVVDMTWAGYTNAVIVELRTNSIVLLPSKGHDIDLPLSTPLGSVTRIICLLSK